MQRRILAGLESRAGLDPRLSWYEARALGIKPEQSELASFRRAAARLRELGLVEKVTHSWSLSQPSTHPYFRVNKGLQQLDESQVGEGPRRRVLVRRVPTEDDFTHAIDEGRQFEEARAHEKIQYLVWYANPGTGVVPDMFIDVDATPLPR